MQLNNWKIFDKSGSQLNQFADSHINLSFTSKTGKNAEGYLVSDVSGNIVNSVMTNNGFLYTSDTSVHYNTIYDNTLIDITDKVDLDFVDVSIFNPDPQNVSGIAGLSNIDISTLFNYPSALYGAAMFLEPTSINIVETEHIYILEEIDGSLYSPYDPSISYLSVQMVGDDDEIKLFTVDEDQNNIIWADELLYDISGKTQDVPLTVNVGFRAEEEGVFERKMIISAVLDDDTYYTLGEISINAEGIGEDERFRTLLGNFGLPDPKDFPKLFKEADINEDYPDYKIVNPKSKQMILDHAQIMPFIGTYKALVNAIKWLGYDDIYVREWFKNVQEDKKLSLIIPYDAKDRSKTLLAFSPEERKVLKKLNQLSLNYCITADTGEVDEWGTPITKNCYEYNIDEVFIKLLSLKTWLEKNIIGVNARITDITGEGIYYERYINQIYSTDNEGFNYSQHQSLTPITLPNNTELTYGEASINFSLLELQKTEIGDLNVTFGDLITYIWDPSDPSTTLSPDDPSYLANPTNYLAMGPTFENPLIGVNDVQWKVSLEKQDSGVVTNEYVTNPLWIYDNEIKYLNILDSSSIFFDASTDLTIILEKAYLRDPIIDPWEDSKLYAIYPNTDIRIAQYSTKTIYNAGEYSIVQGTGTVIKGNDEENYSASELFPYAFTVDESVTIETTSYTKITSPYVDGYVMENLTNGDLTYFDNYVYFFPDSSALLQYALDTNYNVPLLTMRNFVTTDEYDNRVSLTLDKDYVLDILDGKIFMDANSSPAVNTYINFNYDTSLYEQMITMNVEYLSPRMPLQVIDPSIYYWADPSGLSGGTDPSTVAIDNSIYTMHVNHIGDYAVEVFGYDGYNTMFGSRAKTDHNVWIKHPTIYTLINDQCNKGPIDCQTEYLTISETNELVLNNPKPLYERQIPLQGIEVLTDESGLPYIKIPSITYFQDVPQPESINKFFNLTERVVSISGNDIILDDDYEIFLKNDHVKVVYYNKEDFYMISQHDSSISSILPSGPHSAVTLSYIDPAYKIDSSTGVYLLNDSRRFTSNYVKSGSGFSIDISMGGETYRDNQIVDLIITDNSINYSWGSAFRVQEEPIGTTHVFDYDLPDYVVTNPRYSITAKYGFSAYTEFSTETVSATEENNNFFIHLEDDYRQYYLDNTFVMINVLFDHEYVNNNWYDPSVNSVDSTFFFYKEPINVEAGTLVLLTSKYESENYMIEQKNKWTIYNNYTGKMLMQVYNEVVPFVYNESGYYDVHVESYDKYGNLSTKVYEGLIHII